ncbi:hypothetical protein MNBD_GAMMA22-1579 [hydrothermal vent metagenome]|uniref:DUF4381 domain-containing protein n=1 Tax=hydrothermal vent metagenome TaxID=652676 RepID=A0A3B1AAH6_9ZZZZ
MNPSSENTALALRDIHLPDSILWWPLAPGWWIVAVLIVILALSLYVYKKTYFSRKLKKNIKLELEHCNQQYLNKKNAQIFIQQLSSLLRRVSLHQFEDKNIAKLHGVAWLEFLDSKLPENKSDQLSFITGVGKIFLLGPYQKIISEDVSSVYELVKYWLNYNLKNKYGLL